MAIVLSFCCQRRLPRGRLYIRVSAAGAGCFCRSETTLLRVPARRRFCFFLYPYVFGNLVQERINHFGFVFHKERVGKVDVFLNDDFGIHVGRVGEFIHRAQQQSLHGGVHMVVGRTVFQVQAQRFFEAFLIGMDAADDFSK